jgi:succinate-semialdehyde dehydrogenase / glutarate-semialdehyde dehydrogenase
MGKNLMESAGEVEKAIKMIEYYQNNAVEFLQDENLPSKFLESYVVNQPLGPTLCNCLGLTVAILGILPWNFPIWLSFKISLPALLAGNPILIKMASTVPNCGLALEELFFDAYFSFANLI